MPEDRALQAEREVARINAFFPILPKLGNRWAASRPWKGVTVGLNLHVTTLTAALVREVMLGGARCVVSATNPGTTDPGAVALLRDLGAEVFTGGDMEDRHIQVLDQKPTILADVGFDLITTLLDRRPAQVPDIRAAIETTRSGIDRLRVRPEAPPIPIVNINDGRLKDAVENRHGVGDGVWQAVARLTGMHLAGRRVAVIGYGPVGRGIAMYARAANMSVTVVESDPVKRLFAHYDGYPTADLMNAVASAGIVVTATGRSDAVGIEAMAAMRTGVVLLNAGHGGDEIAVDALRDAADRVDHVADQVVAYRLGNGRRLTLLGDGHPLNIVTNSGSPEPVLLHFAVLGLTLEWLAGSTGLPNGEVVVPVSIETEASILALESLQLTSV